MTSPIPGSLLLDPHTHTVCYLVRSDGRDVHRGDCLTP
jgi:hypothetical protein